MNPLVAIKLIAEAAVLIRTVAPYASHKVDTAALLIQRIAYALEQAAGEDISEDEAATIKAMAADADARLEAALKK